MMDEVTIAIVLAFAGVPLAVYVGNPFEKYETKIYKVRVALLGKLEFEKNKLVQMECKNIGGTPPSDSQEFVYNELLSFFKESPFLKYANEYQDLISYEARGEKKIEYLSLSIGALIIPIILFQSGESLKALGYMWLMFNGSILAVFLIDVHQMISEIRRKYTDYVLNEQSFGGYDL